MENRIAELKKVKNGTPYGAKFLNEIHKRDMVGVARKYEEGAKELEDRKLIEMLRTQDKELVKMR